MQVVFRYILFKKEKLTTDALGKSIKKVVPIFGLFVH